MMAANSKKRSTARDDGNSTVESMRQDLDTEQKAKDTIELSNMELESSVRSMEANVLSLEAGNIVDAADTDSDERQKYENQRQLNVQLQEQKRWLEHELEQIKQKIQSEKQHPLPDPFSLDWDNLSETELKRLVGQLEKTRSDLRSDLREMEFRLDKEGREFHHHDDFFRMYQAEIKNLDRILDSLVRNGVIPAGLHLPPAVLSQSSSQGNSFPSTGGVPTPAHSGGVNNMRKSSGLSPPLSPRKGYPGTPSSSSSPPNRKKAHGLSPLGNATDQKLGSQRRPAQVRQLPKLKRGDSPTKEKKQKAKATVAASTTAIQGKQEGKKNTSGMTAEFLDTVDEDLEH